MTARILEVTATDYHSDPCETPSLSSSIAHTLITRSPLHAWTEHPRLGNQRKESSKAMNDGTLIHSLLLGAGPEISIIEATDYRTKAAKQMRDVEISFGRVPVLAHKYEELKSVAATLRSRLIDFGLDLNGESETAIEWRDEGVLCRAMLDHIYFDAAMVLDIKKISSADSNTCSRHAYSYGYDLQQAAYSSAITALKPEWSGRLEFLFVFCEIEPPYAVAPRRPDGVLQELGQRRWKRALEIWKRCLAEDKWPSYCDDIDTLYAPGWAMAQTEET